MALTDNILAYWKLDESSWNATDSVWTNTGVNTGTVTYWTGKINNWLTPDWGDKYLDCGATGELNTIEMSWSMWIKTLVTTEQYIITNSWNNTADRRFMCTWLTGANKFFAYAAGKSVPNVLSSWNVCDWNWHHLVCTVSSTQIILYIDWVWETPVSSTGNITTWAQTTLIASRNPANLYPNFNGSIDEVWIWSRALSAAEVTQLYNGGAWLTYPFVSTNIKSANGVLKNNIKSKNGTVNANIKSRNWVA